MNKLGLNEIRKRFLNFFESKDHLVRPSYSLVPQDDASLLLINAGMAPLKNYFMGKEKPPKNRMATCQKCIRTGDIENVGVTSRHATFFEMLGNFSFGDYFKRESIHWGWEFITEHLEIPKEKLWVSIYENDDEAFEIWNKEIGVEAEKIVRLGKDDNFWEIGTGPCGPCSEIYFDRGEKYGCKSEDCKPGCDCDRYVEFWNHVFTQFDKDEQGNYNPLPNPNIDTGMGLERIACLMQGVDTIFDIDTIKHILQGVIQIANIKYNEDNKKDISIRVITDHIRAVTFLVSDGVLPSNEGRGYVLRRLLRRAARHGKLLGVKGAFLYQLADRVIDVSKEAYPELVQKSDYIKKVIKIEEDKFQETIDQGMDILKQYIDELKDNNEKILSGEKAFKLYDTFGFPIDLTKEILIEEGLDIDKDEFEKEMEKQRNRARVARQNEGAQGWKEDAFSKLNISEKVEFIGYEDLKAKSNVLAIVIDDEIVNEAIQGKSAIIITQKTPFYPEGGGQVGDKGVIISDNFKAKVVNTKKAVNDIIYHEVEIESGIIKVNDEVELCVCKDERENTARNHSATHLLHKALKDILGDHVQQSGSLVTPDRLRFDFTHFEPISKEDLSAIESLVNKTILSGLKVSAKEMDINDAKKVGATALFGEKYKDLVRVVFMGDYSIELCGGTHVENTGQIGLFKILSESGIASGIRRIEAITGLNVYEYINKQNETISKVCSVLKTKEDNLINKAESVVEEIKELNKEVSSLKTKLSMLSVDEILSKKESVKGINVVAGKFDNMDMDTLRNMADTLRDKLVSGVIVLGAVNDNKVNFVATATKDVIEKGVHAGNLIKEVAKIAGGGGGGKPNMAQAGGKDITKIDKAIDYSKQVLQNQIKG
ncbi:alanyl-tRNA synthetase [Alkalithermobacter thermoalcaliphilus JW-YL-7 = DSM 7308]|uniref:Alanine--tRNA ligase n=1 Tax=Alkalithermobacter thermoalcaliphilus JW-YL-7 = DSM 7308 TaxID=1121328 RepID=A0A150FQT9_CLOPD|nr:Alanine-tRNA ligase, eukaryota/bacteria [[Clostridium] paradoxum JW-YL-7 = DSM 7308]SHK76133.1 alanyl-tRNA synthetase [[Clostridium] paradoxum JW-YL-7 = DSM 7308]